MQSLSEKRSEIRFLAHNPEVSGSYPLPATNENRSPSGLLFSLYIDGFVKYKTAEGLSQRTVDSYKWVLQKWVEKMGDRPVGKITSADVLDFMTYLRTEYVPHTFAKPNPAHFCFLTPTKTWFQHFYSKHSWSLSSSQEIVGSNLQEVTMPAPATRHQSNLVFWFKNTLIPSFQLICD